MGDPKYLYDPEDCSGQGTEISSELVKAVTRDDAEEVCRDKASDYGVELIETEHRGGTWWNCIFGGQDV
jgi:hypothetical protein